MSRVGGCDPQATQSLILWGAVLERAVLDWEELNQRLEAKPTLMEHYLFKRSYREVRHWFFSKEITLGSFQWICLLLEVDPDSILARLPHQRALWNKPEAARNPTSATCPTCHRSSRGHPVGGQAAGLVHMTKTRKIA